MIYDFEKYNIKTQNSIFGCIVFENITYVGYFVGFMAFVKMGFYKNTNIIGQWKIKKLK